MLGLFFLIGVVYGEGTGGTRVMESSLRVSFATCSQSSETSRTPSVPSLTTLNVEEKYGQDRERAMRLGQTGGAYDLDIWVD